MNLHSDIDTGGIGKELAVSSVHSVPDSCFTRLHLAVRETKEDFAQDFYLSPDHRFLSLGLFQLDAFSADAERAAKKRLAAELADANVPVRGNRSATVVVSFFADLECPYCREEEALLMRDILPMYGGRVAIAFHHMPLPTHPWARAGSETLACIQQVAPQMFWETAEWVMNNQLKMSPQNVTQNIISSRADLRDASRQVRRCVNLRLSAGHLAHDIELAKELAITSTPTMFIGGHRLRGAVSAVTVRRSIEKELATERDM